VTIIGEEGTSRQIGAGMKKRDKTRKRRKAGRRDSPYGNHIYSAV
jgi:hypothetical protein